MESTRPGFPAGLLAEEEEDIVAGEERGRPRVSPRERKRGEREEGERGERGEEVRKEKREEEEMRRLKRRERRKEAGVV